MDIKNLETNPGLIELNSQELENTEGGIVVVSGLALAGYFLGGIAAGAAIGYAGAAAIEAVEGWF